MRMSRHRFLKIAGEQKQVHKENSTKKTTDYAGDCINDCVLNIVKQNEYNPPSSQISKNS